MKSTFPGRCLVVIVCMVLVNVQVWSQTKNDILNYHFWDDFLFSQHMPDGSIRFFAYSNQTNDPWDRHAGFGRADQADNFHNTILSPLTVDTSYFNWAADEFYFQSLA